MPTWTSNIPSQVKTYANTGAFPVTGSVKTIYIAEDTDIAYYWTGSAYQAISIQDLSGLQTIPIVVNSNITAQNDRVYHVVANATFTDPTGVEGRGYVVFVRNGTATIGGNTAGTGIITYRLFQSGSWTNYSYWNVNQNINFFVPQSRTINGLNLAVDRTLTTANINDSTNRRYVTDAQLTVIGNTSGNNTGDETQSSILSKLGWVRKIQKGGTITGTVSETLVHTFPFTANEYTASSILHVESQFIRTGTPVSNAVFRIRINTANTLVGSTQIGQTTMGGNPNLFSQFRRKFDIESGLVKGINSASSINTDLTTSTLVPLSVSLDTTQDWWLFITCQPQNINDIAVVSFTEIKNF